jgi:hypothetical protein
LLIDLDALQAIETEQDGKLFILRTPVAGDVGHAFQAFGAPRRLISAKPRQSQPAGERGCPTAPPPTPPH